MSVKRKKPDIATDHRNGSHMEEWAWQWDQKLMPVGRFIDAVERGESPALDDARSVAMALRAFFCHRDTDASLAEFATVLGVTRKQGRRESTAEESTRATGAAISIAMREHELKAAGETAARAQAKAIRVVAGIENVPLRTAQAWWKEWREVGRAMAVLATNRATKNGE